MSESIILAIIGLVSVQLGAIIKGHYDTKATNRKVSEVRAIAAKTENSINNRPTSVSDRLDVITDNMATKEQVEAIADRVSALEHPPRRRWLC